ncbi:MAG: YraN family protein [Candidatus Latescibacteria bacterium]|nr:YraN family protein [Candidatus Latescibacterota bacterium]
MSEPYNTGFQGEEAACRYLVGKGYRILDRNYRARPYELDIVARIDDVVVFCEVKTARTVRFGPPASWVTPRKIRHIARAAMDYIRSKAISDAAFRFDVIALDTADGEIRITHIENAFSAPEGM